MGLFSLNPPPAKVPYHHLVRGEYANQWGNTPRWVKNILWLAAAAAIPLGLALYVRFDLFFPSPSEVTESSWVWFAAVAQLALAVAVALSLTRLFFIVLAPVKFLLFFTLRYSGLIFLCAGGALLVWQGREWGKTKIWPDLSLWDLNLKIWGASPPAAAEPLVEHLRGMAGLLDKIPASFFLIGLGIGLISFAFDRAEAEE